MLGIFHFGTLWQLWSYFANVVEHAYSAKTRRLISSQRETIRWQLCGSCICLCSPGIDGATASMSGVSNSFGAHWQIWAYSGNYGNAHSVCIPCHFVEHTSICSKRETIWWQACWVRALPMGIDRARANTHRRRSIAYIALRYF